jgi:hypothetical protein
MKAPLPLDDWIAQISLDFAPSLLAHFQVLPILVAEPDLSLAHARSIDRCPSKCECNPPPFHEGADWHARPQKEGKTLKDESDPEQSAGRTGQPDLM